MARTPAYPRGPLDTPDGLASLPGDFYRLGDLGPQVDALARAQLLAARQTKGDLARIALGLSRLTTPLRAVRDWTQLPLLESDRTDVALSGLHVGGARLGAGYRVGGLDGADTVPAPMAGLDGFPALFDDPTRPRAAYVRGVDFRVDAARGLVAFARDPFADPRLSPLAVLDDSGAVIDRSLTLWAFRGTRDDRAMARLHGDAVGLSMPSSPRYRDLVNVLYDALILGSSRATLGALVEAVCDVPQAAGDGETVVDVARDGRGLLVITDRRAYRFAAGAAPLVAVGDVPLAGDPLVDAVRVDEFRGGAIPEGLAQLALGREMLGPWCRGQVVFRDADTPLIVATGTAGRAFVSAALPGDPADVAEFWRLANEPTLLGGGGRLTAGLATLPGRPRLTVVDGGVTLSLPSMVNPLALLASEVLAGSTVLVRVDAASCGRGLLGLPLLALLRRVVPPHAAAVVLVAMAPLSAPLRAVAPARPSTSRGLVTLVSPLVAAGPSLLAP